MVESKDKISYLTDNKIETREYQEQIAEKCVNKNSLVVIPTGLGKTIIAVLVAAKTLEEFPINSKIVVMAPTRPLINQHYESFLNFLTVPEEKFCVLTGKISQEQRPKLFQENQIIFYTPQTLRNDLVNRKYSLEKVCLLIFDEAHHATGDYPYPMISDMYIDQNPDGNILALTASPGSSKNKITQLCSNLNIPITNIHIRTREDSDVKKYVQNMDLYKIGVNLTDLMARVHKDLHYLLEQRLQFLLQYGFIDSKSDPLYEKTYRKDLVKLNQTLINKINDSDDKTRVYAGISINAQAMLLYHMITLVEQQGLDILLIYLEKLNKEAKRDNCSKAKRLLVADPRMREIYQTLKEGEAYNPNFLVHPKYQVLEKILQDEITNIPNSKILVFIKLRDSIAETVRKLKMISNINPVRFVGQATKSKGDKGLSQKEQIEILEQFKKGTYNVLVSTNVGEEGLDIAECDMVVFYDVVASEIRLIQRKGRTARHREGKVVILYCKDTSDEIYFEIAWRKLKKMNFNLKNPEQLEAVYKQKKSSGITQAFPEAPVDQRQSNLDGFLGEEKEEPPKVNRIEKKNTEVKISKKVPMKYGLRKQLSENDIHFGMVDSQYHLLFFSKLFKSPFKAFKNHLAVCRN